MGRRPSKEQNVFISSSKEDERERRAVENKEIGNRLMLWRLTKGYKKMQLARELGISHQRWLSYESGLVTLDVEIARKLCNMAGLTMDWLYRGVYENRFPQDLRQDLDEKRKELRRNR
jgi:transcriptional regulator with XRE-family HTH domain